MMGTRSFFLFVFLFFSFLFSVSCQPCNIDKLPQGTSARVVDFNLVYIQGATNSTVQPNAPATISNNQIFLSSKTVFGGSSAWLLPKQRVVAGFKIRFQAIINKLSASTKAEGFAFVIQGGDATARGGSSFNLGYNIPNSIAIEFDQFQTGEVQDPSDNHIQLHTVYATLDNSAYIAANVACKTGKCWESNANKRFDDGSTRTIEIWYLPGAVSSTVGQFLVFVDPPSTTATTADVVFEVDDSKIRNMFSNGIVHYGFTASSHSGAPAEVIIKNINLQYVGPEPKLTKSIAPSTFSTETAASQTASPQITIQLYDSCNNLLPLTIDEKLTAKLTLDNTANGVVSGANTASQTGGQFVVYYWSTFATTAKLELSLTSGPITGSPFTVTIIPGAASSRSIFTMADNQAVSPFTAGVSRRINVTPRDRFDNPTNACIRNAFIATIFSSNTVSNTSSCDGNTAVIDLIPTIVTMTGSFTVRLNNIDIISSPTNNVQIVAGPYSTTKSQLGGSARVSSVAGATGLYIYLKVVDSQGNQITTNNLQTKMIISLNQNTPQPEVAGTFGSWTDNGEQFTNQYRFLWSVTIKGVHSLAVSIGSDLILESNLYSPQVLAAAPTAANSAPHTPFSNTPAVGSPWSVQIDAKDQYQNLRDSINPNTHKFSATITQVGDQTGKNYQVVCVDTPTAPSPLTNADVQDFQCIFSNADSRYQISATFLKSGQATINLQLSTNSGTSYTTISNSPIALTVAASAPSAKDSVFVIANAVNGVLTVKAGTTCIARITMKDVQKNTRPSGADLDLVKSATVTAQSTTVPTYYADTDPNNVVATNAMTGTYDYPFIPKKKANYTVMVKLGSDSIPTSMSYRIAVTPGDIDDSKSSIIGRPFDTVVGLVVGADADIFIYSRDTYENAVDCISPTSSAPYTIAISYVPSTNTGAAPTSITPSSTTCMDGVYRITFKAPASPSRVTTTVSRAGTTLKTETVDAKSTDGRRDVTVNSGFDSLQVSIESAFTVNEASPPDQSVPVITLRFEVVTGSPYTSIPDVICNPAASNNYNCKFTPQHAGTYRVRVFANNFESTQSTNRVGILANNIMIAPGPLNFVVLTANSYSAIAGAQFVFTLQGLDVKENSLTTSSAAVKVLDNLEQNFDAKCDAATAGSYQCYAVFSRVATHTLLFQNSSNSAALAQKPVTKYISVTAGILDGPTSSFNYNGVTTFTAGNTIALAVTPLDKYSNRLNGTIFTSFTCNVKVDNTLYPATHSLSQPADSQTYIVNFQPTVAVSKVTIVLVCNDQEIRPKSPLPATITINPGPASERNSEWIGPYFVSIDSSTPVKYTLSLKDAYNNPLTLRSIDVRASWQSERDPNLSGVQVSNVIVLDGTAVTDGNFRFTFVPKVSSPGNYSFNFIVSSTKASFSPKNGNLGVFVNPGPVSSTNSLIQPITVDTVVTSQIPANKDGIAIVQLRDQYGNFIKSSAGALNLYYYAGTPSCDSSLTTVNTLFQSSVAVDLGDGRYQISILSTKAGRYFIKGLLSDSESQPIQRCDANALAFEIVPGALDVTKTVVEKVNDGRAGDIIIFSIKLVDSWLNQIRNSASNVVAIGTGGSTTCTGGNLLPFNPPADTITNNKDGSYTARTQTTAAGNFRIQITVDGQLAAPAADKCPTLAIIPSFVTKFDVGNVPTATAGTTAMLTLTGRDAFMNVADPSRYGYKATIRRTGGVRQLNDYTLILPSVQLDDPLNHYLVYSLAWEGAYTATIELSYDKTDPQKDSRNPQIKTFTLPTVDPFTCAAKDPTKPYRCNNQCVADIALCGGEFTVPTSCASGFLCPSDKGAYCVGTADQCPSASEPCPSGFDRCAAGGCRPRVSDSSRFISSCPVPSSSHACPRDYVMCSDRVSCHRNASACIDLPNSCSAGFVTCRSGACVTRFENCPTDVSCSSGVLCGDGSCRATKDECTREQTLCPSSLPYRCPDGSCRFSFSDCPTHRTCPTGWSKCENGWCVANIDSCKLWKAATNGCPMNTTRCADSSCAPNGLLCPTASTCRVGLIRCADGSCVTDLQSCNKPSQCHPLRPFMCPDGSCAISSSSCPTGRTCGIQHPVKCSDGSCAASASQCPLVCADGRLSTTGDCSSSAWICPSHTPIRCSDGSCVTSVLHCPIEPQCPSVSPIRCADGRCVVSADVCLPRPDYPAFGSSALVNALKCPSHRPVRCPSGDCAESRAFCPSVQSCPLDQTRCVDGTCRTSCPVMSDLCPSQYIQCPQAFQGIACAKSIAECPSAPICPPHTPIKCGDSSCAASLNDCPNVWHPSDLSKTFSINAAPCANGGWAISAPACSSATVCPPWSPVKCWDDSCRALAEDCPPTTKCDASTPYLCVDGTCRERPDSACGQGVVCTNSDRPLKCPLGIDGNLCVANSSQCLDIRSYTPTKACDNTESCTGCSDSRKRCRSGNCVLVKDRCADVLCPAHLPFNCSSGLCARNENECDNDGCPYDAPQKCPDGACVGKDVDCTKDHNAPACGGQKACDDGSCPDSTGKCPLKNGCPEKKYRCWDKSCSDTADGCLDKLDTHNACPYNRPYRCADGYCALSSSVCPIIPSMTDICGVSPSGEAKRFRCADGSCALYQEQCPVVRPCLMNEERCGDGSCRSKGACPAANTCPTDRPTRCPSGLCASSLDACIDELTGCPKNKVKCGDGSCQDSYAQCVNPIGNGCSSTNPFKCSNGECVKTSAECKLPNGCLAATPYRCSDGSCMLTPCSVDGNCPANFYRCEDGRCVGQNSQCQLPNGCPASTPIRCASGNCTSLPAAVGLDPTISCPPVVVCDSLQPYRCADGSCAPSSKHCRPLWSCPSGYQWCAVNNTCITSSQFCPSSCPPSSPTLCADGSCRKSIAFCAKAPQCPTDTPVACYDGICRKSSTDCVKSKLTSLRSSLSSQLDDGFAPENVTCLPVIVGLRSIMCHDARCVAYDWQCALVPACPELKSQRCLDGSCVSYNDTCKEVAACKDGTIRCEDGLCRSFCLPFAGCPNRGKRFYCPGRKDACVADPKDCRTINIDGTITELSPPSDDALLAAFSETGTKLLPGQEVCGKNCQRNNPATPQSVAVSPVAPATIDVSFDDRGSPRARLVVSPGAFDRPTTLSIVPRSLTQINRNNFLFGEKIVSTPFACSPISASSQLMAITAEASVDRVLYDPTSIVNGETVLQTPCFARSTSKLAADGQFSVSPSSNNVNASRQCKGVLKISATSLEFRLNAAVDCSEQVDIKGTFLGFPTTQTNKPYTNNEGSRCMCWNVTESFGNDPLYRAGGLFCGVVARNDIQSPRYTFRSFYKASRIQREYDDPINGDPCPNNANTDEARYTDLSLSDPPACPPETGVIGVNRVAPKDICLGRLDPITDQWSCVKGDYQSRVANPPYRSGNPYWMSSSLVQCDGSSYAFVQIDMPPPPPPPENVCGWWCQYWKYVVGITVGVGGFGLVAAYASSRLVRYRKKYRETKQKNIELHERRKELDEFAGGLGIADDDGEVAMVANPLVIEMQELEQQMKRVNEELKTDQQKEVREIDQLDIERQRLQAEIERVRSLLAQQQKTKAPTRMSDAPLTFAPRPGIPANTATVNPGLGYSSPVVPSGPAMGRQDFGQVRGPSRKKQID